MRSLHVDYSEQFVGVAEKPDSYHELADNFEWAKRDVDQDVEGHTYDECNNYLDSLLAHETGKVIVECGCGLGRNLHRYASRNQCVGVDFSTTGLRKIRLRATGVEPVKADIRQIPLADGSADYVIFCNVLFIYEDLELVHKMLVEARRILKKGGRVIIINDFCSAGVWLSPFLQIPRLANRPQGKEVQKRQFMLYYYTKADSKRLLSDAGFDNITPHLCNAHKGVYHITYLSPVWGVLLRAHRRHRVVRHMDHWERVRMSDSINGAYPLNIIGRMLASFSRHFSPSLASLSLCCSAEKQTDDEV
jgi:ubiquinone/menaquinone biosynthesis C-methylase UbiE